MKKYLLPILLGFAGMFAAHIIILLGFGLGITRPLYFIAYPAVYGLLSFLLTKSHPGLWLFNVIGILLIPCLYWYLLLWDIDKLHWDAITFADAGGMLLILPLTFLMATFISLYVSKRKKNIINSH